MLGSGPATFGLLVSHAWTIWAYQDKNDFCIIMGRFWYQRKDYLLQKYWRIPIQTVDTGDHFYVTALVTLRIQNSPLVAVVILIPFPNQIILNVYIAYLSSSTTICVLSTPPKSELHSWSDEYNRDRFIYFLIFRYGESTIFIFIVQGVMSIMTHFCLNLIPYLFFYFYYYYFRSFNENCPGVEADVCKAQPLEASVSRVTHSRWAQQCLQLTEPNIKTPEKKPSLMARRPSSLSLPWRMLVIVISELQASVDDGDPRHRIF
jgi:hypothetical protein